MEKKLCISRLDKQPVREKVRRALLAYTAGAKGAAKLPGEVALSQEMGVSRNTLRAVIRDLETDGIVYRRYRRGTFISEGGGYGNNKAKHRIYPE